MERGQGDHLLLGSEEEMSPLIHLYTPDQTWAQFGQLASIPVQAAPLLHILDLLRVGIPRAGGYSRDQCRIRAGPDQKSSFGKQLKNVRRHCCSGALL